MEAAALAAVVAGFASTLGWFILRQGVWLGEWKVVHAVYVGVACGHAVAISMTWLRGGKGPAENSPVSLS